MGGSFSIVIIVLFTGVDVDAFSFFTFGGCLLWLFAFFFFLGVTTLFFVVRSFWFEVATLTFSDLDCSVSTQESEGFDVSQDMELWGVRARNICVLVFEIDDQFLIHIYSFQIIYLNLKRYYASTNLGISDWFRLWRW